MGSIHRQPGLPLQQREALLRLGADLPLAWYDPAAGSEVRKRILHSVIKEIVVRVAEVEVQLVIHWQGGDHTLERCAEVTDDAAMEAAGRQRPAK